MEYLLKSAVFLFGKRKIQVEDITGSYMGKHHVELCIVKTEYGNWAESFCERNGGKWRNPNTVKAICRALIRAQSWYEANKEEAPEFYEEQLKFFEENNK